MSFDGFYTARMVSELSQVLINGRITKIHHPIEEELVFSFRSNGKNYKLLFNISAQSHRVQLTNAPFTNPDTPSNFCMVLRKHLEGSKLIAIQQIELDRIITFILQGSDDIGDDKFYHLTIELMGKHSNVFLIQPDTNVIIECMKHIPLYKNSHRTILPNAQYVLPPQQHKKNPYLATVHELTQLLGDSPSPKHVQNCLQGFSMPTITQIFEFQALQNCTLPQAIIDYCKLPTMPYTNSDTFYAVDITSTMSTYASLSEQLDHYYEKKSTNDRIRSLTHAIYQRLQAIVTRNEKKIEKMNEDMRMAQNSDALRIKGELLTANSYQIERGMLEVTLDNFYDDYKPITIALKPEKNATQNAKDYFKKYQKLKLSLQHLTAQLEQATQENAYLESVLVQLQFATLSDIEAIRSELVSSGYIKEKKAQRKNVVSKLGPLRFTSDDGTLILVGRNNVQNDQLTLKQSPKDFIWLHAKDIPGSHVIIQSSSPTDETLQFGAELAAYFSKFKLSNNVPVDYVAIKHIKKPNGAKPGFVIYNNQKTVTATPNEEKIDACRLVE
ncbi:NFACT family protein [Carnobacteriaceae bacterium zg-C25]|nr:NFACT family protein [Carnobacteriaceae bacterium zg-C25]